MDDTIINVSDGYNLGLTQDFSQYLTSTTNYNKLLLLFSVMLIFKISQIKVQAFCKRCQDKGTYLLLNDGSSDNIISCSTHI